MLFFGDFVKKISSLGKGSPTAKTIACVRWLTGVLFILLWRENT